MALLRRRLPASTRRLSLRRPTDARRCWSCSSTPSTARSATPCSAEPRPYSPLIGTLFLFILVGNWSSLIPGVEPPTAHLETDAALALHRLLARSIWFGVRARGVGGYLATFAEPTCS